jgi:hypothetical protein
MSSVQETVPDPQNAAPPSQAGSAPASVAPAQEPGSRAPIIISIVGAIIAAISMVVSGSNFYYATFRPPQIEIQLGSKVLVTSRPRIGGWFTLANSGAQPTTITAATLTWDSPSATFNAAMTSRNLDEWYFTEKG